MKKVTASVALCCFVFLCATLAAAACTPTGFIHDNIDMTAAIINPSAAVTGIVDATGCNIGVYFSSGKGSVTAEIYGANYFGVVVNGDNNVVKVDVVNSNIHDIGESPLNGTQHGVGIYYRGFGNGTAKGRVADNTLKHYQKGGIVANGAGVTANVSDNEVDGEGPVDYIAQNGIQVGFGASAQVMDNVVTGNSYSGTNDASSGGILVVGGDCYDGPLTVGTQIVGNTLTGNDVGVFLSNLDANCGAPAAMTNIKAVNNTIANDAVNNISGLGAPCGYQAGVSDVGNNDKVINNNISGVGYATSTTAGGGCTYTIAVDADPSFTTVPKVHANHFAN